MRKFFKKENKNTDDHSLKTAVLSCALGGLLCTCAFSLTTFAWFTDTVTSPQSTVATGTYSMEIKVEGLTDGALSAGEHTVTLTATGTTTGYATFTIGAGNTLYSAQVAGGTTLTFTLVSVSETTVSYASHWGRYGERSGVIESGATVTVSADGNVTISV